MVTDRVPPSTSATWALRATEPFPIVLLAGDVLRSPTVGAWLKVNERFGAAVPLLELGL